MAKAPAIGIDLGTTNCCVAVVRHGKVEIIANEQGYFVTPSYVAFNEFERLVGDAAKSQIALNVNNTIFDAKRLIGRKFDDAVVQSDMKNWPFVLKNINSEPRVEIIYKGEKKLFSPEEISGMILTKMKEIAEAYLNVEVTDAVITVPAYFNNGQRQATIDAGTIAGLNVLRIINEPTAAAIAYGLNVQEDLTQTTNLLVLDLGGGTFDVSILSVSENVFEVRATNGDTHLGGEDFDCRLVDYCVEQFKRKQKKDIQGNKRALRRLRTACEKAKRILSSATHTDIEIDALCDGVDFTINITRARFEELNAELFRKVLEPVKTALEDAHMEKKDIHVVVLVGGSTRIPKVQKILQEFFDGKALDKSINPEEAVAYGAAIQAAILNGDNSKKVFGVLLKDVIPLSLGIDCDDDNRTQVVIKRNTTIPTKNSHIFRTLFDNQASVLFPIMQGEQYLSKNNYLLGQFRLKGIPPAPKGTTKFDVTFDIDSNGILKVTAVDKETGNTNGITIKNMGADIRKEDIDRMIKDAKRYREEEIVSRKATFAKNTLEKLCLIFREKISHDPEEGLDMQETDKANILDKCEEILTWIEENPRAEQSLYENRHEEIKSLSQKWLEKFKNMFSAD